MLNIYNDLLEKKTNLSVIGLGYVGMPLAVAFAKHLNVIGYDLNSAKIDLYRSGVDPTKEVGNEAIKNTTIQFTTNPEDLRKAKFHIIAVPTPINQDKTPDFKPIIGSSTILGQNLTKGSIVVFESTVYPGVTEDICVPILERESGLKCGVDFKIGYSPERINPGDKLHRLEKFPAWIRKHLKPSLLYMNWLLKQAYTRLPALKLPKLPKLQKTASAILTLLL